MEDILGEELVCIGDIHGELNKLDEAIESRPLKENQKYVFIGDYVDRGKDSLGVIRRLMELKNKGVGYFLLGNHDYVLYKNIYYFSRDDVDSIEDEDTYIRKIDVLLNNQLEGVESFLKGSEYEGFINIAMDLKERDFYGYKKLLVLLYKVTNYIKDNFKDELNFIRDCKLYIETNLHIISHSGGNMDKPISENTLLDWVETRCDFNQRFTNKIRIYGHSPTLSGKVEVGKLDICIDTGADFRGLPIGVFKTYPCKILYIKDWE